MVPRRIDRRRVLLGLGSACGLMPAGTRPAQSTGAPLRFALTPVLLTSDLLMLEELKAYLSRATERPVHLVTRRTYQEITALLVTRQVDAAWICGLSLCRLPRPVGLGRCPRLERQAALSVLSHRPIGCEGRDVSGPGGDRPRLLGPRQQLWARAEVPAGSPRR